MSARAARRTGTAPTPEEIRRAVDAAVGRMEDEARAAFWNTIDEIRDALWDVHEFRPRSELEPFDAALEAMADEFVRATWAGARLLLSDRLEAIARTMPALPRAETGGAR